MIFPFHEQLKLQMKERTTHTANTVFSHRPRKNSTIVHHKMLTISTSHDNKMNKKTIKHFRMITSEAINISVCVCNMPALWRKIWSICLRIRWLRGIKVYQKGPLFRSSKNITNYDTLISNFSPHTIFRTLPDSSSLGKRLNIVWFLLL